MIKSYFCTKENPLKKQIGKAEMFEIERLSISGFLDKEDFDLLTEMSREKGKLSFLDLSGVVETDCDVYNELSDDYIPGICIGDEAFVDSVRLETIILPKGIEAIGNRAFSGCIHLKDVEFTDRLILCHLAFQNCPLLNDFYIGNKEDLNHIDSDALAGSIKQYTCTFDKWPLNEKGEPIYDIDFWDIFSFDGAVFLYNVDYCDEIEMVRYPGGNERKEYAVPEGVTQINDYVFGGCRYLKKITIPESCVTLKEHAITNCPDLETLVFKSKALTGSRICHWDLFWDNIITNCPRLQDIYLYAEDPSKICFEIFEKLDNIGDIVLHVPCFCAKKYREHETEYFNMYDHNDKQYVKEWIRFKKIEEFDPVDFL